MPKLTQRLARNVQPITEEDLFDQAQENLADLERVLETVSQVRAQELEQKEANRKELLALVQGEGIVLATTYEKDQFRHSVALQRAESVDTDLLESHRTWVRQLDVQAKSLE